MDFFRDVMWVHWVIWVIFAGFIYYIVHEEVAVIERVVATVVFSKSGKTCQWSASESSLLNLGLKSGVKLRYECRKGDCSKCIAQLESGELKYIIKPKKELKKKYFFTCITVPAGDVVINA